MNYWYDDAVIYHIYPLGFCGAPKFNEGGEPCCRFDKILDWIVHLKELGVSAVYLGPVFESVEHGYDTTDYKIVDRRLGDNESFKKICREMHNNGIKVILDGVFNHVGREFWAFKDVRLKGPESAYCGWFANLNFGSQSPMGDSFTYESWRGHYNLVKLNLRNPDVCAYLLDVISFWIDEFDIDGIRFDSADCMDFDFFRQIRSFTKSKKHDFWLLGEIIHGDYKRWANDEMLDSVTNYECYKGIYSSHNDKNYFEIDYSINRQSGEYGIYKGIKLYNFLDNHDVNRLASTLKNKEHLYNCYTLMYTMPGIPSVYYGSEFAVQGVKENNSDDNLRPCLDLAAVRAENHPLFEHLVKLGRIRHSYPALSEGEYKTIIIRNQQMLFKRFMDGQTVYIALNLEDSDFEFVFDTDESRLFDVLKGAQCVCEFGKAKVMVSAYSAAVLTSEDALNEPIVQPESQTVYEAKIVIGGKYQFSGVICEVIAFARDARNMEELVIYRDYNQNVWSVPKNSFITE